MARKGNKQMFRHGSDSFSTNWRMHKIKHNLNNEREREGLKSARYKKSKELFVPALGAFVHRDHWSLDQQMNGEKKLIDKMNFLRNL
jgi:hypothetical protein